MKHSIYMKYYLLIIFVICFNVVVGQINLNKPLKELPMATSEGLNKSLNNNIWSHTKYKTGKYDKPVIDFDALAPPPENIISPPEQFNDEKISKFLSRVKMQYYKIAKIIHPDRHVNDTDGIDYTDLFQELGEAYDFVVKNIVKI